MLSKTAMGVASLAFVSGVACRVGCGAGPRRLCAGQRHQDVLRDLRSGTRRSARALAWRRFDHRRDVRPYPAFPRARSPRVAVEEQAHGRTSDRNAPVRFETSADDIAALLEHLHIERADVFGFSNGASVGLQIAIRHRKWYASSCSRQR